MSESRSASKSHDSFNQNIVEKPIHTLFKDDHSIHNTNPNYVKLSNCLELWLSTINISNMNEKDLQLNFYQNCMQAYNQDIGNTLKYCDGFQETIFKNLFGRLMPDFCLFDDNNFHTKSLSSGDLDLEFLPLNIISVLELKTKLKDSDIGQLVHYLRIVLDYSPEARLFILGARDGTGLNFL